MDADQIRSLKPKLTKFENELLLIAAAFKDMDPVEFHSDWQRDVARTFALNIRTLYDCFIDVDGEPFLERLIGLCRLAKDRRQPVLFQ